jgi:hypothetical protein
MQNIAQMRVLQDAEVNGGLFRGAGRQMQYNDFQRFMKNVVDSRMSGPTDLNDYKAITDDTMARLWNLRDDLRRSASAKELASSPGSDTVQNAFDAIKGAIGSVAGEGALHLGAHTLLGPFGEFGAPIIKQAFNALASGRSARRQTARGMEMLRPPQNSNPLQ